MKKYFITGLVILLPVTLTLAVVVFIFNFLTEPFLGLTKAILEYYGLETSSFLFLSAEKLQNLISKILILFVLFWFTILLGAVGKKFFVHYMLQFWEYVVHRIPIVNTVYKACQDVINTIFASKTSAFKQVVLVKFPNAETHTIGLVTRDEMPGLTQTLGSDLLVVFIPTTPNPTSGFLTIFKREDVVPLDMTIEDAFKYVISCGVIMAPFNTQTTPVTEYDPLIQGEAIPVK